MAQEILTMTKSDVQLAMGNYVKQHYHELDVIGHDRPKNIQKVLATIQDRDYVGAGRYNVILDITGSEVNEIGEGNENVHYKALCSINIVSNSNGSPIVSLAEFLILTKQSF